ncbi:flavodoxin [Oenococcus sp.]|uniref:flavodoxin n=1 Tax=Oenococcus sp. TaxID=1979414 RepID=UPI0039E8C469
MKTRVTLFIAAIAIIATAVIGFDLLRGQNKNSPTTTVNQNVSSNNQGDKVKGKQKTLIVYFSRREAASSIYKNRVLKIGNTKQIADMIKSKTNGVEYEIVPVKDYPKSFDRTSEVAQQEQNDNARPKIKNPIPDVSQYDTIFIGAPVWWGDYPMVVHTFLDAVDLNGKNVVPFSTHEGSGLANYPEVLRRQYPKARILKGLAIRGSDVAYSRGDVQGRVDRWLTSLGY